MTNHLCRPEMRCRKGAPEAIHRKTSLIKLQSLEVLISS